MGLACIAFLGSHFFAPPLTKHPCSFLFHQPINPSTLYLALSATSSFRQQSSRKLPQVASLTSPRLGRDRRPLIDLARTRHIIFNLPSRSCLLLTRNGDLQRSRPHAGGCNHSFRGMSHRSPPSRAKTPVREGEAVDQIRLCVCVG
jgi:hypothetical protein